jgi:AcrR family transcriptional regulator
MPARSSPPPASEPVTPAGTGRTRRAASEATQRRILDAALDLFADRSFDGASTRDIAERAGVSQPSLAYHFHSKDELWRAAVDGVFAELVATLTGRIDGLRGVDPVTTARLVLREFIGFAAAHPQLHRIVSQESSCEGERFEYLIDVHVRPLFEQATAMFAELSERGAVPAIDPALLYYILIGAGPTLYVHAPAYRRLTGGDPFSPATVDAHASAVIGLLFGPEPAPGS